MSVKLLTEHHLELLSLKGGCKGSAESTLVKMPHCWKSCVVALCIFSIVNYLFLVRFEPLRLQRSATFHVLGDKEGLVHTMYLCCVIGSGWYSGRQLLSCQPRMTVMYYFV